ncbi:FUSC family protein [Mucilaginibacter sp. Bleaf8]|uniref:FUSC family protein n=1 Tax=Mucilaginibacter sp. Bleaf8 TaxID=2834430 RepID=UPI001BCBADEA|nr:FUSC family membrane protein [Mucilaginibacter sp. Bleaf8]MBS7563118.1 FUSC family protein [Mucilaginibacter sp. Bleaf8]
MPIQPREIKSFFFSQYFSDGLRITFGILLPGLVFAQLGMLELGITLSLGAICICVTDNPGPVIHKRNAMAVSNLIVFLVAVLTGLIRFNLIALGAEVVVLSFLFSMFIVYGNRAASVGTAGVLAMIFTMDKAVTPAEVLPYSATILAGGLWYMLMSLVFFGIRPYRAAQQAIGENIEDVADFLRIKANFYLTETNIDDNYRLLVSKQILVSQHQDAVRELLFKSRQIVKESTNYSRMLVLTFVDLVDLFEQIMATHYDYAYIREQFGATGILDHIGRLLHRMADELGNVGYAVLSNSYYKTTEKFEPELEELKAKIDELGKSEQISNLVLKKVLVNLRDLNKKINSINYYHNSRSSKQLLENPYQVEYDKFVGHQDFSPNVLVDNLNLKSSTFKYSLRVAIVCLLGFIITKSSLLMQLVSDIMGRKLAFGHHSYWVLLTIIVILKPGFSLSKQRNYQRLVGTIIGGVIGVLILLYVKSSVAQFIIMTFLMVGAYSFQRVNYIVMVILMTPYVLILFRFLGVGGLDIAEERIADTALGSIIAFAATYLIFPTWESEQLRENLRDVITANVNYLVKIADNISGKTVSVTEYKLARKDVYIKSANLSAAFERMTSEPKSKQRKSKDVHKFVVLNHILSSYIATIASGLSGKELHKSSLDNLKLVKRSIAVLNEGAKKLGGVPIDYTAERNGSEEITKEPSPDDNLLKEQLGLIHKMSNDIAKTAESFIY